MTIASDLLQRHIQTLVEDNAQWQTLIADDLLWELVYAPALGHPARLSGREEVMRHVTWFLGAVEHFRFLDPRVYAFTDPEAAAAEVKAEALIKSTGRTYRQEYVFFLRAAGGKIAFLRESFDPTRAADPETEAFLDGLRDHGYEVGRNVVVEIRGGSTSPPRRSNTDCRPCSGTESTSTPGG